MVKISPRAKILSITLVIVLAGSYVASILETDGIVETETLRRSSSVRQHQQRSAVGGEKPPRSGGLTTQTPIPKFNNNNHNNHKVVDTTTGQEDEMQPTLPPTEPSPVATQHHHEDIVPTAAAEITQPPPPSPSSVPDRREQHSATSSSGAAAGPHSGHSTRATNGDSSVGPGPQHDESAAAASESHSASPIPEFSSLSSTVAPVTSTSRAPVQSPTSRAPVQSPTSRAPVQSTSIPAPPTPTPVPLTPIEQVEANFEEHALRIERDNPHPYITNKTILYGTGRRWIEFDDIPEPEVHLDKSCDVASLRSVFSYNNREGRWMANENASRWCMTPAEKQQERQRRKDEELARFKSMSQEERDQHEADSEVAGLRGEVQRLKRMLGEEAADNSMMANNESTEIDDRTGVGEFPGFDKIDRDFLLSKFQGRTILFLGDSIIRNQFVIAAARICNPKNFDKCSNRMFTPPLDHPHPHEKKGPWGCVPKGDPSWVNRTLEGANGGEVQPITKCYTHSDFKFLPFSGLTMNHWPRSPSERRKQIDQELIFPAMHMTLRTDYDTDEENDGTRESSHQQSESLSEEVEETEKRKSRLAKSKNVTMIYLGVTQVTQLMKVGIYLAKGPKTGLWPDAIMLSMGPHLKPKAYAKTPHTIPDGLTWLRYCLKLGKQKKAPQPTRPPADGADENKTTADLDEERRLAELKPLNHHIPILMLPFPPRVAEAREYSNWSDGLLKAIEFSLSPKGGAATARASIVPIRDLMRHNHHQKAHGGLPLWDPKEKEAARNVSRLLQAKSRWHPELRRYKENNNSFEWVDPKVDHLLPDQWMGYRCGYYDLVHPAVRCSMAISDILLAAVTTKMTFSPFYTPGRGRR